MSGLYVAGAAVILGGGYLTGKGPAGGLAPKPKTPPPPPGIPDQTSINQAQMLEASRAAALRQGRASTLLTSNANTGDTLGP